MPFYHNNLQAKGNRSAECDNYPDPDHYSQPWYAYSHAHAHRDIYTLADAHTYFYTYGDRHSHCDTDTNSDTNPFTHPTAYAILR